MKRKTLILSLLIAFGIGTTVTTKITQNRAILTNIEVFAQANVVHFQQNIKEVDRTISECNVDFANYECYQFLTGWGCLHCPEPSTTLNCKYR